MIVSKFGGKSYAACSAHLGFALRHVTYDGAADVRVMNVRGSRDTEGRPNYTCACKKPAVFYVFEVVERPDMIESPEPDPGAYLRPDELAQPEAGAPVTGRVEFCRGTHNGKHRDACTACGAKPDGSDW